ncbi:hypothetical protein [Nodosilinea nodulosa]|uniref:hypothetical protein n=1 Tax=Nodosilinea nodulosa TaxID=416001 RepID=UPI0002F2312B|nr:hypothetical protein [Nodosilinea nodulosa]
MEKLAGRLRQQLWFMLALVSGGLAIALPGALPGHAGSVPTGQGSGVTVGGSSILSIGASSLGGGTQIESNSPNATVDPVTGEVLLTSTAQQSLNQSATEISQGLQNSNPVLATALTTPGEIALDSPSPVGASGASEDGAEQTVNEIAAAVVAAILRGESVSLTSTQGSLGIAAPTGTAAVLPVQSLASIRASTKGSPLAQATPAPAAMMATSAVFVPQGGTPMVTPLQGTLEQIANAAGFLAASFAAGLSPNQVATFAEMALAGVDYADLVTLFNAVSGLLPPQGQPQESVATAVDATQLESAIQAYNRILDNTDPDTLVALAQFQDFVVLGRSLQELRAAVDL